MGRINIGGQIGRKEEIYYSKKITRELLFYYRCIFMELTRFTNRLQSLYDMLCPMLIAIISTVENQLLIKSLYGIVSKNC